MAQNLNRCPRLSLIFSTPVLYSLAWLPVLVMALHLQRTVLEIGGGGYELEAQLRGLAGVAQLTLIQKLALFRHELLYAAIFIPVLGALGLRLLPKVLRPWLVLLTAWVLIGILYVELKCYWQVGAFLPCGVLVAALSSINRVHTIHYVDLGSLAKVTVLMGASLLACAAAWVVERRRRWPGSNRAPLASAVLLLPFAVGGIAGWVEDVPNNPYRQSVLVHAVTAFVGGTESAPPLLGHADQAAGDLLARYRQLVAAPPPGLQTDYHGAAHGFDIIFFVLETAPEACVRYYRSSGDMPAIHDLERTAFVSRTHFSTYPYTTRAIFSIYSSLYPSAYAFDFVRELDVQTGASMLFVPGVVQAAAANGYKTAIFIPENPIQNWEHDFERYQALGFQDVVWPGTAAEEQIRESASGQNRRSYHQAMDELTFEQFRSALVGCVDSRQPYLFAFHPQVTHGPWTDIATADAGIEGTCHAGMPLFQVVDGWIEQTVQILRQKGTYERTVIVVTGDHGVRTRTEHSGFQGGTIHGVSFNVPLVIAVPGVLDRQVAITAVSSHIDIGPSIAELLGWPQCRWAEQGTPLWAAGLEQRTTFFLGRNYLGADAYYSQDRILMVKHFLGVAAETAWKGVLSFAPGDLTSAGESRDGRALIDAATRLQVELANSFATGAFRDDCAMPAP